MTPKETLKFLKDYLKVFFVDNFDLNLLHEFEEKDVHIRENSLYYTTLDFKNIQNIVSFLLIKENIPIDYYSVEMYDLIDNLFKPSNESEGFNYKIRNTKILFIYELNSREHKNYMPILNSLINTRMMNKLYTIIILTSKVANTIISPDVLKNFRIIDLKKVSSKARKIKSKVESQTTSKDVANVF